MFMIFRFLNAAGTANRGSLKYSRIASSEFQKFQENLERLTTLSDFSALRGSTGMFSFRISDERGN
jgi:hypothetical protein